MSIYAYTYIYIYIYLELQIYMIASSCCSSAVLLFSFGALLRSLIVKPLSWAFDQYSEEWIDPTANVLQ